MDQASRIRRVLLEKYHLRVQPEMEQYVLSKLREVDGQPIPIRGGEAQTGVAARRLIPPAEIQSAIDASAAINA